MIKYYLHAFIFFSIAYVVAGELPQELQKIAVNREKFETLVVDHIVTGNATEALSLLDMVDSKKDRDFLAQINALTIDYERDHLENNEIMRSYMQEDVTSLVLGMSLFACGVAAQQVTNSPVAALVLYVGSLGFTASGVINTSWVSNRMRENHSKIKSYRDIQAVLTDRLQDNSVHLNSNLTEGESSDGDAE